MFAYKVASTAAISTLTFPELSTGLVMVPLLPKTDCRNVRTLALQFAVDRFDVYSGNCDMSLRLVDDY